MYAYAYFEKGREGARETLKKLFLKKISKMGKSNRNRAANK